MRTRIHNTVFLLLAGVLLVGCKPNSHGVSLNDVKDVAQAANAAAKQYKQNGGPSSNPFDNGAIGNNNSNVATATPMPSNCDNNFYMGIKPQLPSALQADGQFLCFHGFGVYFSGKTKTPLWSAELLTKDRLVSASSLDRINNFHEEPRLNPSTAPRLADYSGTGYDRGHLSPNADMFDRESQFDSFSLANIAPQAPENNRGVWSSLESSVRGYVYKYGSAYVVTGVLFQSPKIKSIKGGVLVPSHFYKAIYFPSTKFATVYVSDNTNTGVVNKMTVPEFQSMTGISVFPMVR